MANYSRKVDLLQLFEMTRNGCTKRQGMAAFDVGEDAIENALRRFEALGLCESRLVPATSGAQALGYFAIATENEARAKLFPPKKDPVVALFEVWNALEWARTKRDVAEELGIGEDAAKRNLENLAELGFVVRERIGEGDPMAAPVIYTQVLPCERAVVFPFLAIRQKKRTREELAAFGITDEELARLVELGLVALGYDGKFRAFVETERNQRTRKTDYGAIYDFLKNSPRGSRSEIARALMMEKSSVGEYCDRLVVAGALRKETKLDARGRNVYAYSVAGPRELVAQPLPVLHWYLARVYKELKKAGTAKNSQLCERAVATPASVTRILAALESAGFATREANEKFEMWRALPTKLTIDEVAVLTRLRMLLRPVRQEFLEEEAGRGLGSILASLVEKKLVVNGNGLFYAINTKGAR